MQNGDKHFQAQARVHMFTAFKFLDTETMGASLNVCEANYNV